MLLGLQRYDFFLKSSILFVCCDSKNTIDICYRLEVLVAIMLIFNLLSSLLKNKRQKAFLVPSAAPLAYLSFCLNIPLLPEAP